MFKLSIEVLKLTEMLIFFLDKCHALPYNHWLMHLGIDLGWLILCLFLTHFRSRDLAGTKMFALFTNLNLFNVHVFKPFKVCKLCIFLKTKICKYWSIRLQYKSVTIKVEKAVYYWFVNINAPSTDCTVYLRVYQTDILK